MFNEKYDKYGNLYQVYDFEDSIDGYAILGTIGLTKLKEQKHPVYVGEVNFPKFKSFYVTCLDENQKVKEGLDYTLLENRKNFKVVKAKDIDEDEEYMFPIIYCIVDKQHVAKSNNDFIFPEFEKEIMRKGEVG